MNWHQFWEANKDLGLNEATRRYRKIEEQQYQEEYAAWKAMNEAKGTSSASAGAAAGGGGSAVGTALYAPVVIADLHSDTGHIIYYWGTIVHANNYIIQRDTTEAFSAPVTVHDGNSPAQEGVVGFIDTDTVPGTTYYYRGKAQDTTGTYLDSPYGTITQTSRVTAVTSGGTGYGNALGEDNI